RCDLANFGVRDTHQSPQLPLLEADQPTDGTLDGDRGPPPQLRSQGVPQHLRLGVVAGGTQGLPQPRIVLAMAVPAAIPQPVRTASALPAWMAGQHQAPLCP